ncbi:MAG: hypothetical protein IMF06_02275 [Proteobacteria bacterium]|nr:hypothetical protein [Pseudomonadota bacterium]
MNIALIVFLYIAAVAILLHPWTRVRLKTRIKKHAALDPYRAISLACDVESCSEMAGMAGRRFLVDEAPDIPLQQCSADACGCRYVHHADRRGSVDRRMLSRHAEEEKPDRRGLRGRRKSDWSLLAVSG